MRHTIQIIPVNAAALAQQSQASTGRPILVSKAEESETFDPVDLFLADTSSSPRVLWLSPQTGEALVGLRCLWLSARTLDEIPPESAIPGPFRSSSLECMARLWRLLTRDAKAEGPLPPLAFVGTAFDPDDPRRDPAWEPFGTYGLLIPQVVYYRRAEQAFQAVQEIFDPSSPPWFATASSPPHPSTVVAPPPLHQENQGESPTAKRARSSSLGEETTMSLPQSSSVPLVSWHRTELVTLDQWQIMIRAALQAIDQGFLEKVVLARTVALSTSHPPLVRQILHTLAQRYPTCTIFAIQREDRFFLGATPERLVRVEQGRLSTVALAGSLPRHSNGDLSSSGEQLLSSPKDLHEHVLVVEAIRDALLPYCQDLAVATSPQVVSMPNVFHLATPITGLVKHGVGILDLAARLHPTPAVCGSPRAQAQAFIRQHEPVPRGWYAGTLGWIDAHGNGELVVALRSALLWQRRVWLFAGCGIVAASDPSAEWEEAEAKLRPMLEALLAGTTNIEGSSLDE